MKIDVTLLSDNTPGLFTRYRLQEVERSPELPICVSVDGICNHADTDYEEVETTYDPSCTEWAYVCTNCGEITE